MAARSPWKNYYFVLRHGESEADVQGLIVSHPDNGIEKFGLTQQGKQQSAKVARELDSRIKDLEKTAEDVIIVSSDFKAAIETSQEVSRHFGLNGEIRQEKKLRERYYGEFELSESSNYERIWANDAAEPSKPKNSEETVYSVFERTKKVIDSLEQEYSGKVVLLMTHKDTMQILSCLFMGHPPEEHRLLPSPKNAGFRHLSAMAGDIMKKLRSFRNNSYYGIRHGKAESNVQGILVCDLEHGESQYGLTDKGKEQAEGAVAKFLELLSLENPDYNPQDVIVVSSPLLRAYETASIIHDGLKCKHPVSKDAKLIERQFGEFNLKSDTNRDVYWKGDHKDIHMAIDDIEPVFDMAKRITDLMQDLEERYSGKVFVFVSHGEPILKMKRLFTWQPLNLLPFKGELPNCSITKFSFTSD